MVDFIFTGRHMIDMGFPSGPHIPKMIELANQMGYLDHMALKNLLPPPMLELKNPDPFHICMTGPDDDVRATLNEVARTPVVTGVAGLPDACIAGPLGTIPVGGVAVSTEIHPGMHSADICCSMGMSIYPDLSPAQVLFRIQQITHFGRGGRTEFDPHYTIMSQIFQNRFLEDLAPIARSHFGTQGDGNHFAYVGSLESTGETVLVTHHGSRGLGSALYNKGIRLAMGHTAKISPKTLKQNTWIAADSKTGVDYWNALQIVRTWTRANHWVLHDQVGKISDRIWNEHNFVFQKSDGLFYHAKGATPAFKDFGPTLIPMNAAEPILITKGHDSPLTFGFSPHGAGRNFSRSEHRRRGSHDLESETQGIEFIAFSGKVDTTELPSAYKDSAKVISDMYHYNLAEITDRIIPYGSIMAGLE